MNEENPQQNIPLASQNLKEKQNEEELKNSVLEQIRTGKVHMRPRAYFMLKVVALVIVAFVTLVTSALLLSFMFFSIRVSGHLFLLGFGSRGIQAFILLFPWSLLLIEILLLVLLEWLLKRFKFGYRSPLLYLLAGLVVVVIAIGLIINRTPFHRNLLHQAEQHGVPIIGGFYDHLRRPPHDEGIFRGVVVSIEKDGFVMNHEPFENSNEQLTIIVPPNVDPATIVQVGETVFVAGDLVNGNQVHAYGIQKINSEE